MRVIKMVKRIKYIRHCLTKPCVTVCYCFKELQRPNIIYGQLSMNFWYEIVPCSNQLKIIFYYTNKIPFK